MFSGAQQEGRGVEKKKERKKGTISEKNPRLGVSWIAVDQPARVLRTPSYLKEMIQDLRMLLELATLPTTTTLAEKQGDQSKSPHLSPADLQYRYLLPTGTTYLLHRRLGSTVNVHLHSRIFFVPLSTLKKDDCRKAGRRVINRSTQQGSHTRRLLFAFSFLHWIALRLYSLQFRRTGSESEPNFTSR